MKQASKSAAYSKAALCVYGLVLEKLVKKI